MYKRSFMSFASLFVFWIVISGEVNLEHITVGIFLSLFMVWFWRDFSPRLPGIMAPNELMVFARCLVMLLGYVIQSNVDVAKTLLFDSPSVSPIFLEMEPGIETNWGRVFLATCITITPGTATIDFDPESNVFTVHALTRETGEALLNWKLIDEIKHLEKLVQRRRIHVLDTGGIHVSNFIGPLESDCRTHRN